MVANRIDFQRIASVALRDAETIVKTWLSDGKRQGHEWVARNFTRVDHRAGSFKINLKTGAWGDFATGQYGGDLISLAAFLFRLSQVEAAKRVATMLGIDPYVR
jgi:hypothetical protein